MRVCVRELLTKDLNHVERKPEMKEDQGRLMYLTSGIGKDEGVRRKPQTNTCNQILLNKTTLYFLIKCLRMLL